jgi:hypothetical protein
MYFQGFPLAQLCFTPDEMQAIALNVKLVTEKNPFAVRQGLVAYNGVAARFSGTTSPLATAEEATYVHWESDSARLKRQLAVALYMHDVLRKSSNHPPLPAFLYHMVFPLSSADNNNNDDSSSDRTVRCHVMVLAELLPLLKSHLHHINGKKVMFAFVCRMRQLRDSKQMHHADDDDDELKPMERKGKTWRHLDVAMTLYEQMHAYVNYHLGSKIDTHVCACRRTTPPKGTVLSIPVNAYTACRVWKATHFVEWLSGKGQYQSLIDFLLDSTYRFPLVTLHALIVNRFLHVYSGGLDAVQVPEEGMYLHLITTTTEPDLPPGRPITVEEVLRIPLSPAFAGAVGGPRKRLRVDVVSPATATVAAVALPSSSSSLS